MGRGAWWAAVRGVAKTGTGLPQLSTHVYCLMKSEALKWDSELLQFSSVTQSCLTLCDPMDCSLPGSSVHGIFQAIVLEWIAISFSRGSPQPKDQTWVSRIVDRCFTV